MKVKKGILNGRRFLLLLLFTCPLPKPEFLQARDDWF